MQKSRSDKRRVCYERWYCFSSKCIFELNDNPIKKKTDDNDLKRKKAIPDITPPEGKKITNKTHISKTDSDASLTFKNGAIRSLKYKNHLTIDADSRVILGTQITTSSTHESHVYLNRIQNY